MSECKNNVNMCDMTYFVAENFKLLMDIFRSDLKYIGIGSEYSKCLYTAVTMFYLLAGDKAKKESLFCYVDNVKQRAKNKSDKDLLKHTKKIVSDVKKDMLKITKCNTRKVYFLMITNSELPHKDPNKLNAFFPGHVCVIEKQVNKGEAIYYLYQSYINRYNLEEYSKIRTPNNDSKHNNDTYRHMHFSFDAMTQFMEKFERFVLSAIWDKENTKFWKEFTLVDAKEFSGFPIQPYMKFCHNSLKAKQCQKEILNRIKVKYDSNEIPESKKEEVIKLLQKNKM